MPLDPLPSLPHLAREFPPEIHAAHTSPRGIQQPQNMTPQKAASLLNKAAMHVKTDPRGKKTVGGRGKARVSKRVGRSIVGSAYNSGNRSAGRK